MWTDPVNRASTFLLPFCADQSAHSYGDSTHAVACFWEVSVVARTPEGCVIIPRSLKPHLIEATETASGPTLRSPCLLEKTQFGPQHVWFGKTFGVCVLVSPFEGWGYKLDHLRGSVCERLSKPCNMVTPLSGNSHACSYGYGSSPLLCHHRLGDWGHGVGWVFLYVWLSQSQLI